MKKLLIFLLLGLSINLNAQNFSVISFSGDLNTICDNLTPALTSSEDFNNFSVSGILNSDAFTGIEFLEPDYSDIKIYPNPCTDFININIETDDLIQIFNITGQNIKNTYNKRINVSDLKTGIYILKSGNFTSKFIKKYGFSLE